MTFALRRLALALTLLAGVAACSNSELYEKSEPIGNFQLGHNVAVAKNAVAGPLTREASHEELEEAMRQAIDRRFGALEGGKLYHLGISIDGYILAVPGVPVVLSPKSALIISVNVWDDAAGKKLNDDPYQITVLERVNERNLVGSGLTQSKQQQLDALSANAARLVEKYLRENAEWFEGDPIAESAEADAIGDEALDAVTETTGDS